MDHDAAETPNFRSQTIFVWAAPSGYHQTYIGRAMGQSGKKEAMIRR